LTSISEYPFFYIGDEEGAFVVEEDESDLIDYDDPTMRLYLDSADQKQWETWAETGMFYGFTTNPTILKRDNVQCTLQAMRTLARHAFDLEAEELQFQAWGKTWNDLYSCGLDLFELDSRIVVKIPMTQAGVKAAHRLLLDDVPVTFTGVYSTHQAVTALSLGAYYVAPYLGRMNDAGKNVRKEKKWHLSLVCLNVIVVYIIHFVVAYYIVVNILFK